MKQQLREHQHIEGRYFIESLIGQGEHGFVWRAWHEDLEIPLAIKEVDVSAINNAAIEQIRIDSRIGKTIRIFDTVVWVRDTVLNDSCLLIVMEYMAGGSLATRLREGSITFEQALKWTVDISFLLEQMHLQNIIHCDIKPQNILFNDRNNMKLSDFGIYHMDFNPNSRMRPRNATYKAPELSYGYITGASDIYSLCAILFELWTGQSFDKFGHIVNARYARKELLNYLEEQHPYLAYDHLLVIVHGAFGGMAGSSVGAGCPAQ